MYKIECPYCEEEVKIDCFEDDKFEEECPHCGECFKVEVESEPVFRTSQFNYVECEECERTFDKEYRIRVPSPKGYNSKSSLCDACWFKLINKDED